MVWSNWRGAIWRGALAVVLVWTGLAWTQTQAPKGGNDAADRIMVVHENSKSKRCRVLESWQLPDGKLAHLLQSVETGELVTIVDDQAPTGENATLARGPMTKRIFSWGVGKRQPPEGSPLPPHFRHDSGIVVQNDAPIPPGATPTAGNPAIVQRVCDDKAIGGGIHPDAIIQLIEKKSEKPDNVAADKIPADLPKSVLESPTARMPTSADDAKPATASASVGASPTPTVIHSYEIPMSQRGFFPRLPRFSSDNCTTCEPGTVHNPIVISEMTGQPVVMTKRGWRPGDLVLGMFRKSESVPMKIEEVKTAHHKTETPKAAPTKIEEPKSVATAEKVDGPVINNNKNPEKSAGNDKITPPLKVPFSTAMSPVMPPADPESKKPQAVDVVLPPPQKVIEEKPIMLPAPKDVAKTEPEKRDMWGLTASDKMIVPGKNGLDNAGLKPEVVKLPTAPVARTNDPLTTPERLMPRASVGGPIPMERNPMPANMQGWPVGTQSVAAAKNGIYGPLTYVPVPTVTVPQPIHPPVPPAPMLPDAPQLNAYVNAFSPPPGPKAPMQTGASSMPQWMQPNPNVVLQQQMMQQQAMQQQMMMQQMMAQAYRQNPGMMQASMQQPSNGPMTNGARHYTGPMAPNPVQHVNYQPMMPMSTPMQPASYQPMPMQQPMVMQQVDQLIKLMRESPYPAHREWAAHTLASMDWRMIPQIVPAVLTSATQDPAPSVRACCVQCLGRMGAAVEPVVGTLHNMRQDIDPSVRQEVEATLFRFNQATMMPR